MQQLPDPRTDPTAHEMYAGEPVDDGWDTPDSEQEVTPVDGLDSGTRPGQPA